MRQSILWDRDGFQVREDDFPLPENAWKLDPQTKRAMTICNLFVNHRYGVSNIVSALDEDCRHVVSVLLNKGIIRDRRVRRTEPPGGIDRRRTIVSPNVPLRTPKATILNSDTESLE
jgi:hypothetical protein